MTSSTFSDRLSRSLSKEVELAVHHFSAVPVSVDPLFIPQPGEPPEPTECESHFLSASILHDGKKVQVFATEILVYTTTTLTTIFVSKADSTGYLSLLNLTKRSTSPIKAILIEFLDSLVEAKHRDDVRLVLSLFARGQNQYLFPGSIENERKHVLDDRALIKWWMQILDQILLKRAHKIELNGNDDVQTENSNVSGQGYLIIPGCDRRETELFIPEHESHTPSIMWQVNDPFTKLNFAPDLPERCLIPRFPDDPKARFAIDLDDELPRLEGADFEAAPHITASGKWRSVRTLAQFWEMMSFRQECSAGRLVGFLWAVFEPAKPAEPAEKPDRITTGGRKALENNGVPLPTPIASPAQELVHSAETLPIRTPPSISTLPLPPKPSQSQSIDRILGTTNDEKNDEVVDVKGDLPPIDTIKDEVPPLVKPASSELVLQADAYARCMKLLLTLDYCDTATATESSDKFISAVDNEAGKDNWGVIITGTRDVAIVEQATNGSVDPVRKRSRVASVTILDAGLVRKKVKAQTTDG